MPIVLDALTPDFHYLLQTKLTLGEHYVILQHDCDSGTEWITSDSLLQRQSLNLLHSLYEVVISHCQQKIDVLDLDQPPVGAIPYGVVINELHRCKCTKRHF